MDLLLCNNAVRPEEHGKIYCKESGFLCAHIYYCQLQSKYKQLPSVVDCPQNPNRRKEK